MRILITGATGFIGRHLVARLAAAHEVYALVRRPPAAPTPVVQYICQDLAQPLDHQQLPQQLDAIIHQATVIDTDAVDEATPFLVNVVGTWRLLAYAAGAGIRTFVHASTGGVYGCSAHPLRESDPLNPMDLYSLTKAQAELAVQAAAGDFHKVVLRYFFPYGVGTPNPIPSYVRQAVQGEPITILAGGGPWFNPLHISDAVEMTVQALALDQTVTVNIAGQEATTFAHIATIAARHVGREPIFQSIPDETAIAYYRANLIAATERTNQLFPRSTWVSLQQGIIELATHTMKMDRAKPFLSY